MSWDGSEPQRSFRLHVSKVFGISSLADFMREGCVWPSQQEFVENHIDFTLNARKTGEVSPRSVQ